MRKERRRLGLLDVELDAVVHQITNQATIEVGGGGLDFFAIVGDCDNGAIFDGRLANTLRFHLIEKIRVSNRRRATCDAALVKLLKDGKQHQGNDDPDGSFRKHVVHAEGSWKAAEGFGLTRTVILLSRLGPCYQPNGAKPLIFQGG